MVKKKQKPDKRRNKDAPAAWQRGGAGPHGGRKKDPYKRKGRRTEVDDGWDDEV